MTVSSVGPAHPSQLLRARRHAEVLGSSGRRKSPTPTGGRCRMKSACRHRREEVEEVEEERGHRPANKPPSLCENWPLNTVAACIFGCCSTVELHPASPIPSTPPPAPPALASRRLQSASRTPQTQSRTHAAAVTARRTRRWNGEGEEEAERGRRPS